MLPGQRPIAGHLRYANCWSACMYGALLHELGESKILPCSLFGLLCSSLDTECSVLVGDDIVFIFRVQRLVLRRHKDLVIW